MKNLNEEVNKIKHLFNFKKGDVVIESMIKESSESKSEEFFKMGDVLEITLPNKETITIKLTDNMTVNEPGNYSWGIMVNKSSNKKLTNKTGTLGAYSYSDDNTISEYTIFLYDENDTEILNTDINSEKIKLI
jgi:hypothetical protein